MSYPPHASYPPPYQPPYQPPVKESHTVRNIVLVVVGVLVLGCGGCFALVAVGLNEAGKSFDKYVEDEAQRPGSPYNPIEVRVGEPFVIDEMEFQAGWRVQSRSGTTTVKGLRVLNDRTGEDRVSEFIEIKFMRGTEALAVIECTSSPIPFGETQPMSCVPAQGSIKGYERVTANDTF